MAIRVLMSIASVYLWFWFVDHLVNKSVLCHIECIPFWFASASILISGIMFFVGNVMVWIVLDGDY